MQRAPVSRSGKRWKRSLRRLKSPAPASTLRDAEPRNTARPLTEELEDKTQEAKESADQERQRATTLELPQAIGLVRALGGIAEILLVLEHRPDLGHARHGEHVPVL